MTDFSKVVRIGTAKTWGGRYYSVFCKIQYQCGKLSITGVEGPTADGNCFGGCGQIVMSEWNIANYADGWTKAKESKFREVWNRWHLNDMKAECEHQRAKGQTHSTHPSAICEECGYKLGSAWLREEVPAEIIGFLQSLSNSDRRPSWV